MMSFGSHKLNISVEKTGKQVSSVAKFLRARHGEPDLWERLKGL